MSAAARQLFGELLDVPRRERERIYAERQVPATLRAEVSSLLSHDVQTEGGLTGRVSEVAGEAFKSAGESSPYSCGPYQLIHLLGSGGMGAVYLAERRDGEIEQKVAVKLLRADADRHSWRDRFLRERQLLAYLNHPSIARLLDAGHTSDGRPYLVMEYVEGVSIDEYASGLGLRDQLSLFLLVCEGVSHAHRRLIVHRDLKPANILVDSSGQPKLLDFGIAKLIDPSADETRTIERLLTPNYASPEQIRGDIQTTATDIYSLGAVLYKLLTSRSPREPHSESATTRPTMTDEWRVAPPSRLNAKLPRDIDHILGKALRHEPEERYASVDAFADDIRAFLDSRPVRARAGNTWYRTRKFFRRFWIPTVAILLALTSLLAGIFVVNRERVIAERRFNDVRQLSTRLFDIEKEVRRLTGGTKARQLIVETSLDYLRSLAKDAHGDAAFVLDLGTAYMRVARVQGVPITSNLGDAEKAEQNLRIAEGMIGSVLAKREISRTAFLRAAQIAHDRMVLAQLRHANEEALTLAHASGKWLQKYLDSGKVEEAEKDQVVIAGMNVANWYIRCDEMDAGLGLLRRTIAIARATNQPSQAGAAQIVMARALRGMGDLNGALAAIQEGVRLLQPPPGEKRTGVRTYRLALATQGEILGDDNGISLGRPGDALEYFERGFEIATELVRQDASDFTTRLAIAGDALRLGGLLRHSDPRRSIAIYSQALQTLGELKHNSKARLDEIRLLAASTYPLRQVGRIDEARQNLDAAFARLKDQKLYPAAQVEPGSEADVALRALAEFEAAAGNVPRGIEIYEQLRAGIMASKPKPELSLTHAFQLSTLYRAITTLQRRSGQLALASELAGRDLELWRHWNGKLPQNSFVLRQLDSARNY